MGQTPVKLMKKTIMLLLLMVISAMSTQARVNWWNKDNGPVLYGVELGPGVSYIGPGDSSFGITGGATVEVPFIKALRLISGLRGAWYSSTYTEYMHLNHNSITREDRFNVMYLQIPAKLMYSLYFTPKVRLNIGPGLYYGLGVTGSLSTKIEGGSGITGGGDLKLWDVLDRSDFGYTIGLSVTIKDHFDIGVEVCNSILDNSKSGDGDWYNSLTTFTFTYIF